MPINNNNQKQAINMEIINQALEFEQRKLKIAFN